MRKGLVVIPRSVKNTFEHLKINALPVARNEAHGPREQAWEAQYLLAVGALHDIFTVKKEP